MAEAIKLWTPPGRLLSGNPMVLNPVTDRVTRQPVIDPKTGKQKMKAFVWLAIERTAFDATIWPIMWQVGQRDWPGVMNSPNFKWKKIDGDKDIDEKGKPYREREGYPGHIILKIGSSYVSKVIDSPTNGNIEWTDPARVKRGHYFRCYISINGNGPVNQSPGLYINPELTQWLAFGTEISGGIDVDAALAAAPAIALPVGASAAPLTTQSTAGMPLAPPVNMQQPASMPPMTSPPPPPPVAAAPFPPPGWTTVAGYPGWYTNGAENKTEADLRAVVPHVGILTPPMR